MEKPKFPLPLALYTLEKARGSTGTGNIPVARVCHLILIPGQVGCLAGCVSLNHLVREKTLEVVHVNG